MSSLDSAAPITAKDRVNGTETGTASTTTESRRNNTPGQTGPMVSVTPPKLNDLQPSYAQVLVTDDQGAHGWYGSMSTLASHVWDA